MTRDKRQENNVSFHPENWSFSGCELSSEAATPIPKGVASLGQNLGERESTGNKTHKGLRHMIKMELE